MIELVNDVSLILPFIKKFFPQYSLDNNPYEKVIVYKINNDIIGFVSFSLIYERMEINYIAVDVSYRRCGCAQKMFDFILKNYMVENISLEVNQNNKEAINFYLKNGFEIKANRKNYYDDNDAYLMVLEVK